MAAGFNGLLIHGNYLYLTVSFLNRMTGRTLLDGVMVEHWDIIQDEATCDARSAATRGSATVSRPDTLRSGNGSHGHRDNPSTDRNKRREAGLS
jgi:hypothetical protein